MTAAERCVECDRLVAEAIACLEMNVDPADRNSTSYVVADRDGRNRCPVHGSEFYRKAEGGTVTTRHHVEVYRADGAGGWGWQCFTCRAEAEGFDSLADAETAGADHGEAP